MARSQCGRSKMTFARNRNGQGSPRMRRCLWSMLARTDIQLPNIICLRSPLFASKFPEESVGRLAVHVTLLEGKRQHGVFSGRQSHTAAPCECKPRLIAPSCAQSNGSKYPWSGPNGEEAISSLDVMNYQHQYCHINPLSEWQQLISQTR